MNPKPITALVIEPSALMRKVQKRLLEDIGVLTVIEARDGLAGLAKLQASKFAADFVLTYWEPFFLRELRRLKEGAKLPVVVANSNPKQISKEALALGADACVAKHIRRSDLSTTIGPLIGESLPRGKAPELSISGNIANFGLKELVHFLNFAGKSGILEIRAGDVDAGICFQEGHIHNAWLGPERGEQAFFALTHITSGDFEFLENKSLPERTINRDTVSLLMDALEDNNGEEFNGNEESEDS